MYLDKHAICFLILLAVTPALSMEPACETPLAADYDGDAKCDPADYERSRGLWQVRLSAGGYVPASLIFGAAVFTAVTGDFDGDGKADPALYQDDTGSWLVKISGTSYAPAVASLGGRDWRPVPADYDGDGKADPAVYEKASGNWLACLSGSGYLPATFPTTLGGPTYTAVPGDFDGDRKADPAVYGNGMWGVLMSGQNYALAALWAGMTGGVPFSVDFDGDRKADPALCASGTGLWTIKLSALGYGTATTTLGGPGMTPLAGDFDGDGRADPAAYRESDRTLTVRLSGLDYQPASLAIGEPPAKRVLVLYDSSGTDGWWGKLYAQQMQNLVSHFNLPCRSKPVEQYEAGDMAPYSTTFYIGSIYDNPLPAAFQQDVMTGTHTLCWVGYNVWQVAWTGDSEHNPLFTEKFGFQFDGNEPGFTQAAYKGKSLVFPDTNADVGVVSLINSNVASILATAWRGTTNDSAPYITRGSNFWYIGDNPIVSDTMADRALIFADLMHDMLAIPHATNHRGVIRIEDVSAETPAATLQAIAECLHERQVPFVVSLIPVYLDPLGVAHQGFPTRLALSDNPGLVQVLQAIGSLGGQIIQHGTTHQYDATPNPIGATAADYEFFRVVAVNGTNIMLGSLVEDSPQWAGGRVAAGKAILAQYGLTPLAWLTPHYYASEMDYGVFPVLFPLALDRGVYFTADDAGATQSQEQLAPFSIIRDGYGQKRLPESIGYISPAYGLMPSNLIARADANLVVRDGWAGCYYHWYFGTNYLPELVDGITNLGYRFVPIDPGME